MPRALTAVAALAALCGTLAIAGCNADDEPGPPAAEFEATVPEGFFGINGQGLRALADTGELELLDTHLAVIADGAIDYVRANTDWSRLEPRPPTGGRHSYDFTGIDAWVRALAEHGLAWEPAVMGVPTPSWAVDRSAAKVCGARGAPARAADVAALAGAIARRYGSRGTFWRQRPELDPVPVSRYELWNEPNLASFWCPVPDADAYAAVADRMADAILAADPRATLMLGGLAGFDQTSIRGPGQAHVSVREFLAQTLAARPALARKLDVVAVHAYGTTPAQILDLLAYHRRAVLAAGLGGLPLSFNEVGWYTAGLGPYPPIGEAQRAVYLAEVTSAAARSDCGLDSFAPHTWTTREQNVTDVEQWYGIADPETAEPHPSGEAYIDQVLLFEGRAGEPPPTEAADICS